MYFLSSKFPNGSKISKFFSSKPFEFACLKIFEIFLGNIEDFKVQQASLYEFLDFLLFRNLVSFQKMKCRKKNLNYN